MERVTDEVTTYVEREDARRVAYDALCKRFGITGGNVDVALGVPWKLIRRTWRDRAEDISVQWINPNYRDSCASFSEDDPDYALTSVEVDYGRTFHRIFEKALRDPDEVKDCRYVVAFWRNNKCEWVGTFFTFREADDFAFETAKGYLDERGIPRNEEPARYASPFVAGDYIKDQVLGCYWDNDEEAEVRVSTIEFGESYPYEHEQEVA